MSRAQIQAIDDGDCCDKEESRLIPDLISNIQRLLSDAEDAQDRLHGRLECLCSPSAYGKDGDTGEEASRGSVADSLTGIADRLRTLADNSNEMTRRVQV
jgi:hypothetical protein